MPSFSLVGALEFRRVVSSLQKDSASSRLSVFESPLTPYGGSHYHRHRTTSGSRTPSRTPHPHIRDLEQDPWDAALGVPLDERSPPTIVTPVISETPEDADALPAIAHTPASPASEADSESQMTFVQPSSGARAWDTLAHTAHILFPTLHDFGSKSFLGKVAALFAAPAVMLLTLTLPVVVTAHEDPTATEKRKSSGASEARLIDFEEEGEERALIAEDEVEEGMHEMVFNKWLLAAQCCLGPLFCAAVMLGTSSLHFCKSVTHYLLQTASSTRRFGSWQSAPPDSLQQSSSPSLQSPVDRVLLSSRGAQWASALPSYGLWPSPMRLSRFSRCVHSASLQSSG